MDTDNPKQIWVFHPLLTHINKVIGSKCQWKDTGAATTVRKTTVVFCYFKCEVQTKMVSALTRECKRAHTSAPVIIQCHSQNLISQIRVNQHQVFAASNTKAKNPVNNQVSEEPDFLLRL